VVAHGVYFPSEKRTASQISIRRKIMAKTKLGGNQLNFSGMSAFTGSAGVALSSISDSSSGLVLSASRVYLAQNPAESLEAATKAYVDSVAGGGVTSQQVAYGNADGSSVASDSGLWYSPDEDKLYLSGTFEGAALQSVAALDIDALSGALALDGSGGINIGTSTDVAVDFNASTWDLDASGAITVDGVGLSLDSTSAANLTATGATLVLSTVTSGELDITSADLLDINAGANLDIDVTGTYAMDSTSTFSIDGVGASNVTTNGALTLSGSTGLNLKNDSGTIDMDSRQGAIDIDAATTIDIDGATGINIGKAADVAVDFDSAAFDLDASGAITIDGTSTFSVDAVGTSNVTTNGALTISGSTGLNLDADSGTLSIQARLGGVDVDAIAGALALDGAGGINIGTAADVAVDFDSAAFDLDASGAITIDTTSGGISLDAASGPVNLTSGDSGASVGAASTLALTAGTTSTYTAGTSIALSVAGNAVATVSANTLTISDADTLALGASTLSGETAIGWKEPSFVSNFALVTATAADTEANTKGSIVAGDGIASMVYSGSGAGAHNPGLILSGATGAESLRMNSLRVYNNGLLLQSGSSYDYVASYILTGSGNAFGGLKVEFNSAAEPVAGDVLSVDVAAVAAHGQA